MIVTAAEPQSLANDVACKTTNSNGDLTRSRNACPDRSQLIHMLPGIGPSQLPHCYPIRGVVLLGTRELLLGFVELGLQVVDGAGSSFKSLTASVAQIHCCLHGLQRVGCRTCGKVLQLSQNSFNMQLANDLS